MKLVNQKLRSPKAVGRDSLRSSVSTKQQAFSLCTTHSLGRATYRKYLRSLSLTIVPGSVRAGGSLSLTKGVFACAHNCAWLRSFLTLASLTSFLRSLSLTNYLSIDLTLRLQIDQKHSFFG